MLEKKKEFKYVSRRSNSNLDKTNHLAVLRPNNIFAVPLLHTAAAVVGVKLEPIRQSRL